MILTFHSGEDKLVKRALKEGCRDGIYADYSKDVVRPSAEECAQNGRARSTKMRWAIRAKSGTNISFFYKYTGQRKEYYYHEYTTPDNKKESEIYLRGLPSYHYGDITVTQKLTSFLSLNVGVKNLFNLTDIRTIVESANDTPSVSYLGCGRSYFIGLNLMLNGKFKK